MKFGLVARSHQVDPEPGVDRQGLRQGNRARIAERDPDRVPDAIRLEEGAVSRVPPIEQVAHIREDLDLVGDLVRCVQIGDPISRQFWVLI